MRDSLGILLVGALAIAAVIAFWDSTVHFVRLRGLQDLYARQPEINNMNSAAQSLAGEALEYSKTNPAIDPLLAEFHLKVRPGVVQTNQPSTNQPGKKAP
jgi:hypothetical protein